ncbi:hypothetical protein Tco_0996981 [Tanacetum coccineum]
MNARPVRQENTIPIVVGQHYGFSDFSEFRSMQDGPSSFNGHKNMGAPPNFQTPMRSQPSSSDWQRQMPEQSASHYWQPSSHSGSYYSFGQPPSHMVRPKLQTTIETQHDVEAIVDQVRRRNYENIIQFRNNLYQIYLDCYMRGGEHMNSWMELMIRRRPSNANWTVAYTSTISVHP